MSLPNDPAIDSMVIRARPVDADIAAAAARARMLRNRNAEELRQLERVAPIPCRVASKPMRITDHSEGDAVTGSAWVLAIYLAAALIFAAGFLTGYFIPR